MRVKKTYAVKLKIGVVFKKKARNEKELREELRRWFATGAAGVAKMRGYMRATPELIEEITEIPTCPDCGSEHIHKTGLASGVGSGPGLPSTSPQYKCSKCGNLFSRQPVSGRISRA